MTEDVAVRILEPGDLHVFAVGHVQVALQLQPRHVVVLEGNALRLQRTHFAFDVVDGPRHGSRLVGALRTASGRRSGASCRSRTPRPHRPRHRPASGRACLRRIFRRAEILDRNGRDCCLLTEHAISPFRVRCKSGTHAGAEMIRCRRPEFPHAVGALRSARHELLRAALAGLECAHARRLDTSWRQGSGRDGAPASRRRVHLDCAEAEQRVADPGSAETNLGRCSSSRSSSRFVGKKKRRAEARRSQGVGLKPDPQKSRAEARPTCVARSPRSGPGRRSGPGCRTPAGTCCRCRTQPGRCPGRPAADPCPGCC